MLEYEYIDAYYMRNIYIHKPHGYIRATKQQHIV
jgi:hypothetical protein